VAVLACATTPASAAEEFITNVIRGLEYFGYQFDVEGNPLGGGKTFSFAADYRNGAEFDFGCGTLLFDNGIVAGSIGYTTRCCGPKFNLTLETTNGVNTVPLDYSFSTGLGLTDFDITGEILIDIDATFDTQGFYDVELFVSNRGTYTIDGGDPVPIDFDIGPISESGNIFCDAFARLTDPFFQAANAKSPFDLKAVSGATGIKSAQQTADELQARLDAGEILSQDEITALVNSAVLSTVLSKNPQADPFGDLVLPEGLLGAMTDPPACENCGGSSLASALAVPEPGSLIVLILGALATARRRRH
jgi:hypothetical protein